MLLRIVKILIHICMDLQIDILIICYKNLSLMSLLASVTGSCFCILSLSLYLLLTVPSRRFEIIFVWDPAGACLILSGDRLTNSRFLTVSAFKELVVLVFMQFICEHIFSTLGEECGRNVLLVMKYDNKEKQLYHILNYRYAVKS